MSIDNLFVNSMMLLWTRLLKSMLVMVCSSWVVLSSLSWFARSYPIKEVSKPKDECKSEHWDALDDSCKMTIPKVKNANYSAYMKDRTTQAIYSDVWWWSYDNGWDFENGGAPSVDIATSEGTPVYAFGDGKVIFAGELKWYGNSVTIEHNIGKWKKIWSSYSHLSEIDVKKWDTLSEWDLLGKVGKSWFTIGKYGNHLDFALTITAQKNYPYAYYDCKSWYMKAVQEWVCRDLLVKNTVDPLLFLEQQGNLEKTITLGKASIESSKAKKLLFAATNKDSASKKALDTAKLATINEKIYSFKTKDNLTIEIVDLQRKDNELLKKWWKAYVTVVVKKDGKPYDGYLGKELAFVSKNKTVGIAWWTIDYVKWWEKTVILYGDKKGDDTITIKLGDQLIGVHSTKVW